MTPDDIKDQWLSVIRHLQAKCSGNNGYAVIDLRIVVAGDTPVIWREASMAKIHPKSIRNLQMTPQIAALLGGMIADE